VNFATYHKQQLLQLVNNLAELLFNPNLQTFISATREHEKFISSVNEYNAKFTELN
jgi:hypothetical protein